MPFSPHALSAFQSIARHLSYYPHNLSGYSYLDFAAWKASGRQETYLIQYMFHYIETGLEAKLTTPFPRSACPVCLALAVTGATQGVPCPPRGLWALGTFHSLSSAGTQELEEGLLSSQPQSTGCGLPRYVRFGQSLLRAIGTIVSAATPWGRTLSDLPLCSLSHFCGLRASFFTPSTNIVSVSASSVQKVLKTSVVHLTNIFCSFSTHQATSQVRDFKAEPTALEFKDLQK